jgi:acetyl esterase
MAAKHYLDPHNAAFAEATAGVAMPHILGYAKAHEVLEEAQKREPASDIETETLHVAFEDVSTNVVIFRPKSAPGPCPMVYYTHGGGWILGRYGQPQRSGFKPRTVHSVASSDDFD